MPARGRSGAFGERPRFLAPGPDQAVIGGGFDAALGNVRVLVLDALLGQPGVMLQRVIGVPACLGGIRVRAAHHQQVLVQILGRVLETGRTLNGRAAAATQVDLATGQCRGAPVAAGAFHQQHACPGPGRLERCAGAGGAEAEHDDVRLEVPARYLVQRGRMT